jgi:hypothetical protein
VSGWSQQQVRAASAVAGAPLSASTSPTSLIPSGARGILYPDQDMSQIGKMYQVTAQGRISTLVTTPGTLTLDVRFVNPAGTSVIVHTSQALALNVNAKTNVSFIYQIMLTLRAVGSGTSANLIGIGSFTSEAVIGSPLPSAGGSGSLLIPASAPAVGTGFDSCSPQIVDFFGTWSVNSGSNSITVEQYVLESLN